MRNDDINSAFVYPDSGYYAFCMRTTLQAGHERSIAAFTVASNMLLMIIYCNNKTGVFVAHMTRPSAFSSLFVRLITSVFIIAALGRKDDSKIQKSR